MWVFKSIHHAKKMDIYIDLSCEEDGCLFSMRMLCVKQLWIFVKNNPFGTQLSKENRIPKGQRLFIWGNSDIPYLKQTTTPDRIEQSTKQVICFTKNWSKDNWNIISSRSWTLFLRFWRFPVNIWHQLVHKNNSTLILMFYSRN